MEIKINIETKKTDNHQNYNKKNKRMGKSRKRKKQEVQRKLEALSKTSKYQNVRGIKAKIDALDEVNDDYKPNLICLVEIQLSKEEQIRIPGYRIIYRNDGTKNSKGILIAVRNSIKTIL